MNLTIKSKRYNSGTKSQNREKLPLYSQRPTDTDRVNYKFI